MTKAERFIANHEKIKARAIAAIFKRHKALFVDYLNALDEKLRVNKRFEIKAQKGDIIDPFIDEIAPDVPAYMMTVLPTIMKEGARGQIKRYKDLLPTGYSLAFDIETSPASKYLKDLEDLMLSQKDGSISKTTKERLLAIMEEGVANGESYGEIAKQIQQTDPWVFSKARATLIAVNEVGRAYGWANHEPAVELQRQGYVMVKQWTTSHDEKVRATHTQNEKAGLIPLSTAFPGTGDQFAPSTNEIRCRCTSTHKIIGIDNGEKFIHIPKGSTAEEIRKKYLSLFEKKV